MTSRVLFLFCWGALIPAAVASSFLVRVFHDYEGARSAETIVIPFKEVQQRLPDALLDRVVVRDAQTGQLLPSQVTNFDPDGEAGDNDLLWQYSFGIGEQEVHFMIETTGAPVPPRPTLTYARYVPERFDDFAFENDRIGHRMYGPALESPAAGSNRMTGSGIDVWTKRVRYPVIDRWYLKGGGAYHRDTGEGLDFYSAGQGRGAGGTGVWRDGVLHPSNNWETWRVLANGPIRTVFELNYALWDAGEGLKVSETKRFTIDAGRNLHRVESAFKTWPEAENFTLAIGLGKHEAPAPDPQFQGASEAGWMTLWETYRVAEAAELGTAVIRDEARPVRFVEGDRDFLMLMPVQDGETQTYFLGAGWTRSGDFDDRAAWLAYVKAFADQRDHPLTIALGMPDDPEKK